MDIDKKVQQHSTKGDWQGGKCKAQHRTFKKSKKRFMNTVIKWGNSRQ